MESLAITQKDKGFTKGSVTLPPLKEHQVYVRVRYAAFNPTDRTCHYPPDPLMLMF